MTAKRGEWWDVVDRNGVPTGEVFRRGATGWPAGRFHRVVATCVVSADGLVLLTQRADGREFPLAWEFPGGSALAGEAARQAAARELREETGLIVPEAELRCIGQFVETSALLDMYVARARGRPSLRLDPAEVHAAAWVAVDEVELRLAEGQMAEPWVARLEHLSRALWPAVLEYPHPPQG